MKKKYTVPQTEITVFETKDVLTASEILTPGDSGSQDKYSPIHWEDDFR